MLGMLVLSRTKDMKRDYHILTAYMKDRLPTFYWLNLIYDNLYCRESIDCEWVTWEEGGIKL